MCTCRCELCQKVGHSSWRTIQDQAHAAIRRHNIFRCEIPVFNKPDDVAHGPFTEKRPEIANCVPSVHTIGDMEEYVEHDW
jgi:hypothetical protein